MDNQERLLVVLQHAETLAPEWIRLLPLGDVELGDGRQPFQVTSDSVEKILTAWQQRGNDMVIDYEHQTVTGGEAPAAGWIKEMRGALDGLWARVEWTEKAQTYLANREYRYFSPVVQLGDGREVTDLLHAALTNFPAIANLPPLVAKGETSGAAASGNMEDECMIEDLKKRLGLNAEAGEAEVLTALDTYHGVMNLVQELGQELGLNDVTPSTLKGAVLALKSGQDKLATIETELAALRQERQQDKAAAAVEAAVQAGKVSPAQRDWALKYAGSDLEGFAAYAAAAPKVVPVTEPSGQKPAGQASAVTAEELQMCRAMGLDPEKFKATRQAERRAVEEVS